MAENFPTFPFTTQEDWYGELSFISAEDGSPLSLEGRNFVMLITPAASGAELVEPKIILTMEPGGGLSLKNGDPSTLIFRVTKEAALELARMEYTADVLEVVSGSRYLFMPTRIQYFEPSALRTFLSRFLGVKVSFSARRQPIITPIAVAGREGRPGATIINGTAPPTPTAGKDGDFFIEDRTATSQGRRMYGPKVGGAWPGTPWSIQVAGINDVPGLSKAISDSAQRASNLSDLTDKSEARDNLELASVAKSGSSSDVIYAEPRGQADRSVSERFAETTDSFLADLPKSTRTALLAGIGSNDDFAPALNAALAKGRSIRMPDNLGTLRIQSELRVTTPRQHIYWGSGTRLLYDPPTGTPIRPGFIVMPSAYGAEIHGLELDHNAFNDRYIAPTIGGGNLGLGSALMIMAHRVKMVSPIVKNGWDNCIGVAEFELGSSVVQHPGSPQGVQILFAETENGGCGNHPEGEQAGAGINSLTSTGLTVIGGSDRFSRCGLITDYAAGAGVQAFGFVAYNTQKSPVGHQGNFGGIAFYILGSDARIVGCAAFDPAGDALVFDGYSGGNKVSAFRAKGGRQRGAILQGNDNSLTDARFDLCSYESPGAYNAIEVVGTGSPFGDQQFGDGRGLRLSAIETTGGFHDIGVLIKPGTGLAYGSATDIQANGRTAAYRNLCPKSWADSFIMDYNDPVGSIINAKTTEQVANQIAAIAAIYNS